MRCASLCPQNAIEAGHSWGVALYFLTAIPAGTMLLGWLGERLPPLAALDRAPTRSVLDLVYLYSSLFVAYALFHLALRIPVVNALFAKTTFTHYWGRHWLPRSLKESANGGPKHAPTAPGRSKQS